MSKFVSAFLLLLIIFISSIGLLLFTNSGNSFLKPYISSYLSKKYGLDIKIDSLTLKPNFLDILAIVNKNSKIILNGDIDIWQRKFDLDFMINANDIKTKYANMKGKVDIKGKVKGDIKHLKVKGAGLVFNSKIRFDSIVEDKKIKNLHLFAGKVRIGKLLSLLNKPPYLFGVTNIDINFDDLNPDTLKGVANVDIPYASVNSDLVKKDLNITLPKGIIFREKSKTVLKDAKAITALNLTSNLADLKAKEMVYKIKTGDFESDYTLFVSNLSLLKDVTKYKLRGSFKAEGMVKKDGNEISYHLESLSLGGHLKAVGVDKRLEVVADALRLDKLLYILNQPKYSYANIDMKIFADNLGEKEQKAEGNITLGNGTLNGKILQKEFNVTIPADFGYESISHFNLENDMIYFASDLNSSIFNAKVYNTKIKLKDSSIDGKYTLSVDDLSKLKFLTKRDIEGRADTNGTFKVIDGLVDIKGLSDIFGTNSHYEYKNGDININSSDIDVLNLLNTLKYPPVFDSNGSLQAYYSPKWKKGVFSVKLKDGHILRNQLSDTVFALTGFDITKELYKESILRGNIKDSIVNFNFDLNSTNTNLKAYSAIFDMHTQEIKVPFVLKIKDKDVEGEIVGNINHPKVKINSSSYIKNKIEKVIDKKVPKKFQEPLKQLLNLFGR